MSVHLSDTDRTELYFVAECTENSVLEPIKSVCLNLKARWAVNKNLIIKNGVVVA